MRPIPHDFPREKMKKPYESLKRSKEKLVYDKLYINGQGYLPCFGLPVEDLFSNQVLTTFRVNVIGVTDVRLFQWSCLYL